MKLWDSVLLTHFRSKSTSLCRCFRVTRTDGQVFAWTEHTESLVIDGLTYLATTGLGVSSTQTTDTMAVPTIDVTAFLDVSTEADILAGIWDSADVIMFEANYRNIPTSFNVARLNILRSGKLGRISLHDNIFQAELLGLGQALNTRIGSQYTTSCPWQLGDAVCAGGIVPLNIAAFTFAGIVSAVSASPRLIFSAVALDQRRGIFNRGTITFSTGANANLPPMDIRTWSDKQFTMQRPLPYAVAVGDTFAAIWGDDKTFATCRDRFNNAAQFRGFHFLPGIDKLLEDPIRWKQRPIPVPGPDDNPDNDGTGGNDGGGGEGDDGDGGGDSGE
jgi:uncharacterized phage protein (TIGR02218 family)